MPGNGLARVYNDLMAGMWIALVVAAWLAVAWRLNIAAERAHARRKAAR